MPSSPHTVTLNRLRGTEWNDPGNRMQGAMIDALRAEGVDDDTIYRACSTANHAYNAARN